MTAVCPRVDGEPRAVVCLQCTATEYEDCPYVGLSAGLTQSHRAIRSEAPATCDPTDGVCEACQ